MTPEHARTILSQATGLNEGTFTILRLGEDPGAARIHELRLALRVLWRKWKAESALPFDISQAAAVILHFRSEAERNLQSNTGPLRHGIENELADVAQGAFELLSGRVVEGDTIRRPDLGEGG